MEQKSMKHHMAGRLYRQRGASLLEGIAYLAIATIVILGAVSLLTGAFSSAQSNRAVEEVVSLRTAVRKLYAGQAYPEETMQATLIAARAVPGTFTVTAAGGITNAWGGVTTVTGATGGLTFNISYAGVPVDACINMVSGASGWTNITAGKDPIAAFPATAAAAAATCAGAGPLVFTSN